MKAGGGKNLGLNGIQGPVYSRKACPAPGDRLCVAEHNVHVYVHRKGAPSRREELGLVSPQIFVSTALMEIACYVVFSGRVESGAECCFITELRE